MNKIEKHTLCVTRVQFREIRAYLPTVNESAVGPSLIALARNTPRAVSPASLCSRRSRRRSVRRERVVHLKSKPHYTREST